MITPLKMIWKYSCNCLKIKFILFWKKERKLTPAWNKDKERVIDQIRINWALGNQFSEEDVFKVEGILDVNTIEYFPCPIDIKQKDGTYQL